MKLKLRVDSVARRLHTLVFDSDWEPGWLEARLKIV
jgi:hypothetical protein